MILFFTSADVNSARLFDKLEGGLTALPFYDRMTFNQEQ